MFDDARYLREQALLCLEIARSMSSNIDAERMRQQASAYTLRAERLENGLSGDDVWKA